MIYVDDRGHMLADTDDELKAMAEQLGADPFWSQPGLWHLTTLQTFAVEARGARQITGIQMMHMLTVALHTGEMPLPEFAEKRYLEVAENVRQMQELAIMRPAGIG